MARRRLMGWLALGILGACGGRADKNVGSGGSSSEGGTGEQRGGASAGQAPSTGGKQQGAVGGAPTPDEAGAAGAGVFTTQGGAPGAGGHEMSGHDMGGQDMGGGGAGDQPSRDVLAGDYDVYLAAPPVVTGCSVAWYEPRINLTVYRTSFGKLLALPFADFFYLQGTQTKEPEVRASTVVFGALSTWEGSPTTPALELGWNARGFLGSGSAQIPYTCEGGTTTTRPVPVTVEADRTPPKLRIEPASRKSFAFTRFGFAFSEPVQLPSGAYDSVFSEPADGEQVVDLYDVNTNESLAVAWKWSLGGPVAQAHFVEPAAVEGLTMAARLTAQVTDRRGNVLVPLEQKLDILPAALLDTELDFDREPIGVYGNASYHAAAEPGAECEQGGCLVLDGPVVECGGAPRSTVAVRLASPWNEALELRYRVWASTRWVSPIEIGFASGCTGWFSVELSQLAQPDGPFTHGSDWKTQALTPCGGPENESGFTLSLACAESSPPPQVRVVIERITRLAAP